MNGGDLDALLEQIARGTVAPADARRQLGTALLRDLEYAHLDHVRPATQGTAEVVFGAGKTPEQVLGICRSLHGRVGTFLVTRAESETRRILAAEFPAAQVNETARTVFVPGTNNNGPTGRGTIVIVTAGTSDLSVAEEARVTADALGNRTDLITDVGVAGIHRILGRAAALREATVVVVIAGMDGALASVVGGMVDRPVIAVPTSVGYGAAFGGVSALLAMLNSCAAGVTVTNIDNGYGAAVAASRINHLHL